MTIEYLGSKTLFGGLKKISNGLVHDALTDNVDLNAKYWDFNHDKLDDYKKIVEREYKQSNQGIRVAVTWTSDPIDVDISESVEGLIRRFDIGQIGTRERYTILKEKKTAHTNGSMRGAAE